MCEEKDENIQALEGVKQTQLTRIEELDALTKKLQQEITEHEKECESLKGEIQVFTMSSNNFQREASEREEVVKEKVHEVEGLK